MTKNMNKSFTKTFYYGYGIKNNDKLATKTLSSDQYTTFQNNYISPEMVNMAKHQNYLYSN